MKRASIASVIAALVVSAVLAVSALAATKTVSVKDDVFAAKSITEEGTRKWV